MDPLAALVALVRDAAREGVEQALTAHATVSPASPSPLLTKQALAAALSISTASVDRLVRDGRIPFVRVGDVRRFDLDVVRAVLGETIAPAHSVSKSSSTVSGVRLLSRGGR